MKPSELTLFARSWLPLVETFGRVERELAAAFIVEACVHNGDIWGPVTWKQIAAAMKEKLHAEPWKSVAANPMLSPNVHDLIAKGFASWVGEKDADGDQGVVFTPEGMAVLERELARQQREAAPRVESSR